MIKLHNHTNWLIDPNGINIVTVEGKVILDMRNECIVEKVSQEQNQLIVHLLKDKNETDSSPFAINQQVRIIIANVHHADIPALSKSTFEGIYDFTSDSLNLCIDDRCYLLHGSKISIELE